MPLLRWVVIHRAAPAPAHAHGWFFSEAFPEAIGKRNKKLVSSLQVLAFTSFYCFVLVPPASSLSGP